MQNFNHTLVVPIVSITLAVIVAISASSHHKKTQNGEIYRLPLSTKLLMVFCTLAIMVLPFLPGIPGNTNPLKFLWSLSPIWIPSILFTAFFFRYRVILTNDSIAFRVGDLREEIIPISEIIDTLMLYHGGDNSRPPLELFIYARGHRKIKVSGLVQDVADLEKTIISRIRLNENKTHDCPEKIKDIENIKIHSKIILVVSLSILLLVFVGAVFFK